MAIQRRWGRGTKLTIALFVLGVCTVGMKPQDETTHWSRGFALYAVEMKQGWFAAHGIKAGDVIKGLPPRSAR